jgi:hypothetical protein
MKKIMFIVFIISAYVVLMTQSVSAVEYGTFVNHVSTTMFPTIGKIEKTFERYRFFFKTRTRDIAGSSSPVDYDVLVEKIIVLKKTMENIFSKSTSIQLIFQLLIALIIFTFFIVTGIGTTLVVAVGSLATLVMVGILSLVILLIKIITPSF